MKIISTTLILILLGLGSHTAAEAETLPKAQIPKALEFSCRWASRPRLEFTSEDLDIRKVTSDIHDTLNIAFEGTVSGQYGGQLYVVRRLGKHWASNWGFAPNAPLGDVRTLPLFLGPAGAKIFSFFKFDDHHVTMPDVIEVNGALDHLDALLKANRFAGIDLRFAEAPSRAQESLSFVTNFVRYFKLPMAHGGFMAVHDMSFHLPSIFFDKLLRPVQKISGRLQGFIEFVDKNSNAYPELGEVALQRLTKDMSFNLANLLDAHTGNLVFVLDALVRGQDSAALENLTISMDGLFLTSRGRSIDDVLDLFVISALAEARKAEEKDFADTKKHAVLDLLQKYKKANASPEFSARFGYDPELTLEELKNRITQIKIALAPAR